MATEQKGPEIKKAQRSKEARSFAQPDTYRQTHFKQEPLLLITQQQE
jgi:hypothetical protein